MLFIRSAIFGWPLLFFSFLLNAQTWTARPGVSMSTNSGGFYEYLPQGYSTSQSYPLLIFCHGLGESGDGNGDLGLLLNQGIPNLIQNNQMPASFDVGGTTYRFIILCPQFTAWPNVADNDINQIIDYATQHYSVNLNRVYVTGLSMGGGITFSYASYNTTNANRIAAIVPICAALLPPGATSGPPYLDKPDSLLCRNITATNLPVWATHNQDDDVVPVSFTDSMVHYINAAPSPVPLAKKTIFTTDLYPLYPHNAWAETYDPNFTENGLNVYQWMLQYQRAITPLPVAIENYKAFLSAPAEITITWTTASESNNDHFTMEWSVSGNDFMPVANIPARNSASTYSYTDGHPSPGLNYYRLSQTDRNGTKKYYPILSVRMDAQGKNHMVLFPNPATGSARLQWAYPGKETVTCSVIDMNGVMVKQWSFHKTNYELDQELQLNNLTPGVYLLHLSSATQSETLRFTRK